MHGFTHLLLLQASLGEQSVLTLHSGLHEGGLPINPTTHEQTACPFISRHWLFGPHGLGWHGCKLVTVNKKNHFLVL